MMQVLLCCCTKIMWGDVRAMLLIQVVSYRVLYIYCGLVHKIYIMQLE